MVWLTAPCAHRRRRLQRIASAQQSHPGRHAEADFGGSWHLGTTCNWASITLLIVPLTVLVWVAPITNRLVSPMISTYGVCMSQIRESTEAQNLAQQTLLLHQSLQHGIPNVAPFTGRPARMKGHRHDWKLREGHATGKYKQDKRNHKLRPSYTMS